MGEGYDWCHQHHANVWGLNHDDHLTTWGFADDHSDCGPGERMGAGAIGNCSLLDEDEGGNGGEEEAGVEL